MAQAMRGMDGTPRFVEKTITTLKAYHLLFDNFKDAIVAAIGDVNLTLRADLHAMGLEEFNFFRWTINSGSPLFSGARNQ